MQPTSRCVVSGWFLYIGSECEGMYVREVNDTNWLVLLFFHHCCARYAHGNWKYGKQLTRAHYCTAGWNVLSRTRTIMDIVLHARHEPNKGVFSDAVQLNCNQLIETVRKENSHTYNCKRWPTVFCKTIKSNWSNQQKRTIVYVYYLILRNILLWRK